MRVDGVDEDAPVVAADLDMPHEPEQQIGAAQRVDEARVDVGGARAHLGVPVHAEQREIGRHLDLDAAGAGRAAGSGACGACANAAPAPPIASTSAHATLRHAGAKRGFPAVVIFAASP